MKYIRNCENCGSQVESEEYYNEQCWMLEQHYECKNCGFIRDWAYGYITPEDSEYKEE